MKRLILILGVFLILLFGLGVVSACIIPPTFESKKCTFSYEVHNENEITELLNNKSNECSFNQEDINILKEFLSNGYIITEQTNAEYDSFLEQVKIDNGKKGCAFAKYTAVFHNGKWTGVVKGDAVDESGDGCPVPTCGVMTAILPNILWSDLDSSKDCKNLYWFDNTDKSCGQKEFCGMYMYYGLETFETKGECMSALNSNGNDEECSKQGGSCGGGASCCDGFDCLTHSTGGLGVCVKESWKDRVKIMPETASLRARERLGELGFNVTLKQVPAGNGGIIKVVYSVEAEKEGKVFGLFRARGKVQALVNAETGDVEKINKPWWAFLATGI